MGLLRRARRSGATVHDRGSFAALWVAIGAGVTAGAYLQFAAWGRMPAAADRLRTAGFGLLVAGLIVRWAAILTLGRLFTTNVAIQTGHRIVRTGLYRRVRHPAYSGLLLAFAGLGVAFGSWLSLAAVMVPITAAVLYRIHVEERALIGAFGEEYREYCNRTKRLVPGVY
ncbi:MAG: isoprenylcysteine carboxylmethyltransferase family protein [bacterium]